MTNNDERPFIYTPPDEPYLTVLHQDEDILVLDKPSGLLSVPGRPLEHRDCLASRAQERFPSATVVHRLDLDTSGVIVMALHRKAHRHLGLQFERRKTKKSYVARVWGQVEGDDGRVDLPLTIDWPNRPKHIVDHDTGRPSQTDWQVIEREAQATRMRLTPITGRSHQLRVHMLALGHPIIGDPLYAPDEAFHAAPRLQLHAESLTLHHPKDGELVTFTVPCPF